MSDCWNRGSASAAGQAARRRADHGRLRARDVTFANGMVARELLVDYNDKSRRLVYPIVVGGTTHYSASVQVLEGDEGNSKIVWIIDLLPNEMAGLVGAMAAQEVAAMKKTLGGR